jgi:cell pole-organizing protein PopZ
MEEILASIRKIISDDQDEPSQAAPQQQARKSEPEAEQARNPEPAVQQAAHQQPQDEIYELTQEVRESDTAFMAPAPSGNDVVFETVEETQPMTVSAYVGPEEHHHEDELISSSARRAVGEALGSLDREPEKRAPVEFRNSGSDVETVFSRAVQDAFEPLLNNWIEGHADEILTKLKPLIREWMDENLPPLVEAAVQREIASAARTRRR